MQDTDINGNPLPGCENFIGIFPFAIAEPNSPKTIVATLDAGTHSIFVGNDFNGVPCSSPYTLTLTDVPPSTCGAAGPVVNTRNTDPVAFNTLIETSRFGNDRNDVCGYAHASVPIIDPARNPAGQRLAYNGVDYVREFTVAQSGTPYIDFAFLAFEPLPAGVDIFLLNGLSTFIDEDVRRDGSNLRGLVADDTIAYLDRISMTFVDTRTGGAPVLDPGTTYYLVVDTTSVLPGYEFWLAIESATRVNPGGDLTDGNTELIFNSGVSDRGPFFTFNANQGDSIAASIQSTAAGVIPELTVAKVRDDVAVEQLTTRELISDGLLRLGLPSELGSSYVPRLTAIVNVRPPFQPGGRPAAADTFTIPEAGTYILLQDRVGCGPCPLATSYEFLVSGSTAPERVMCSAESRVESSQPCFNGFNGENDTNGGCDINAAPQFDSILFGETVCGTVGVYETETGNLQSGGRPRGDTDWYEFTITEPSTVRADFAGEFQGRLEFITSTSNPGGPPCGDRTTIEGASFRAETPSGFTAKILEPGTYYLKVSIPGAASGRTFVQCGAESGGRSPICRTVSWPLPAKGSVIPINPRSK